MSERSWTWLTGTREQTRAQAHALLAPDAQVLWVGGPGLTPRGLRRLLGTGVDAVVLDVHDGLDPDTLAQAQGFVRAGGRLILTGPPVAVPSPQTQVTDGAPGTTRLHARLQQVLGPGTRDPVRPTASAPGPTHAQDRLVDALTRAWQGPARADVVLAERGRGKSAALGRAIRQLGAARVAVSAPNPDAVRELLAFAAPAQPTWVPVQDLPHAGTWDVIVLDEAAGVSVPLLQALTDAHPRAHLALATTTAGYEGTGRGFVLRFLHWLDQQPRPVHRHTLSQPLRWAPGDPLEGRLRAALLLDATLGPADPTQPVQTAQIAAEMLSEAQLGELMGLLIHAHYRTTPADLLRVLDAPNLRLHLLLQGDHVVGVNLLALEGGLSPSRCAQATTGQIRLRGHALPDTLMTQARALNAGALDWVRSVRIAVHPDLRGQGAGRRLADHTHRAHSPDAFGTMFGATPALLRFRLAQGYRLVRVSAGRNARSGEPSATLVRPVSPAARALVDTLQPALARDLPVLLRALSNQGPLPSDLAQALRAALPAPAPWSPGELHETVRAYAAGPQAADHVLAALHAWLPTQDLSGLLQPERALLHARVRDLARWDVSAAAAGYDSVRAAQRAMRRIIAALI